MKVKICGIGSSEDALAAEAAGADYLGAVLSEGFDRTVPEARVPALFAGCHADRVAVLVDESPDRSAELGSRLGAAVLQLHGSESVEDVSTVRSLGSWRVWKAVRAQSLSDVHDAVARYGPHVDGILVEGRKVGVVGGGGARLDLDFEPDRVRASVRPHTFVLAGGLTPENVREAVARYAPDVVDVSSGVERARGKKDAALMEAFVRAARAGARPTGALDQETG